MQKPPKRKQLSPNNNKQTTENAINRVKSMKPDIEPYPFHPRPTPEDCLAIRDKLLQLHGFPQEFLKYRLERENSKLNPSNSINGSLKSEDSDQKLSVLDGLVSTVLSQNTTDVNSQKAFASLKAAFPTWELVLAAEQKLLEDAIRCGGLAPTKASCIKNILKCLKEKSGKLCLEYLRDLPIDKIKLELSSFKGIGPKTVACVLMFHLQQGDFPVDTHILQIATTLGWVPEGADAKKTYVHLNQKIPNELKFDLNCLLFTHGKMCDGCSSKVGKREKKESVNKLCPLLNYSQRSSLHFSNLGRRKRRSKQTTLQPEMSGKEKENSAVNTSSPLYLHPSENNFHVSEKLQGISNFRTWKRSMEIALAARRKLGFVTGVVKRDTEDEKKQEMWDTCKLQQCSYLLDAWVMSESIKRSVLHFTTAREIWQHLEKRFIVSNGSTKYRFTKELYETTQEGLPVNEYFTKMCCIWEELENLNLRPPITQMTPEVSAYIQAIQQQQQEQYMFQFLNGLDDEY